MKNIAIVLSLILLSSCSSGEREGILPDFHKVEYLTVKDSIDLEALDILRPTSVHYKEGLLVFQTAVGWKELQFLDLNTMHVNTKKFVGQGPDEVTTYTVVDNFGSPELHFADANLRKILSINLDSVKLDEATVPRFLMNTPDRKRLTKGFETDRYMYYIGFLDEGRFLCYNKKTKEVTYLGDFPENEATSSLPAYSKSVVYGSCMLFGKEDRLVAKCHGVLDFYEIADDGNLIEKAQHYYFLPRFFLSETGRSASWSSEDIIGFYGGCSNDSFLYFLYSDMTYKEKGAAAYNCPYLMAYDWDGNPVCEYHLEKPLWDVAVNGKTIYGLSREKEAILYIYELP